ncbi:class I SAM-dependent methyltransferase [Aquisphaera insulae]|uniref:class I SAM-dependent methyltransferase n=1 Tax=Aquisphaera insulae TaxID=2712864 RepID=UPI0013EA75F6|nr:class I SAM-dependent methyltransferase [Aquisphaera insulae]
MTRSHRRDVRSTQGRLLLDTPHGPQIGAGEFNPAADLSVPSQNEQVSRYWADKFKELRENDGFANPTCCWDNRLAIEHITKAGSGSPQIGWLGWLLNDYLKDVPNLRNCLSLCCGDGNHELAILKSREDLSLRSFDVCADAVQVAVQRFEREGISRDRFHLDVRDANDLDIEGKFDLIIAASALHHVENLEALIPKLSSMLNPGGYFALMEYVGPDRFQWTEQQVAIINGILEALDPYYLNGGARNAFVPPTVEAMIQIDPSEAIRSSQIPGLVRKHFRVEVERNLYFNLLHPIFPWLNNSLSNKEGRDFDSILRLLIYFEKLLIDENVMQSDFAFLVCRPLPD